MATPTLSPTSVTVPHGGTADVTVSWTLDPGSPDVNGTLSLMIDGSTAVSIPVVHQGSPAESVPTLRTSNPAAGEVLVTSDVALVTIVAQGNPGTVRLS